MTKGLMCFAVLMISSAELHSLDAQPTRRTPTPPQPRKESLRHRLLRYSGLADNPSTLKGPEQDGSGQIWLAELGNQQTRPLTTGGGYRSPVFIPGRTSILALKGADIVRLRLDGGAPERVYTISGISKLVGFNRDAPDQLLVVTEDALGKPTIGLLSTKTGRIVPIPYDAASSDDRRMLEHLRGWDRVYGRTSLDVRTLTKESFSGRVQSTDVFLTADGGTPINVSRCEGADCGQPSLSTDRRLIVFIKVERE